MILSNLLVLYCKRLIAGLINFQAVSCTAHFSGFYLGAPYKALSTVMAFTSGDCEGPTEEHSYQHFSSSNTQNVCSSVRIKCPLGDGLFTALL